MTFREEKEQELMYGKDQPEINGTTFKLTINSTWFNHDEWLFFDKFRNKGFTEEEWDALMKDIDNGD